MLTQSDINIQQRAVNGFEILGPIASTAVPQLSNLISSTNSVNGLLASTALGNIGPPALPALMAALTNRNYGVSTRATLSIVNSEPMQARQYPSSSDSSKIQTISSANELQPLLAPSILNPLS
jgi:hypothetical protein